MQQYDHKKIEKKWQKVWAQKKLYKTTDKKGKNKFYVLDMFPYPSGAGLHVGHPRGYIGSDVYARMKRMQGYNVLHPMGYDAFGLPAEQYAIEHKIHPRKAVEKNVATFEKQLSIIGLSYDWSRKVNTTDPEYYKWTQWIFLKLYNHYYDEKLKKAEPISELIKKFEKEDKNWKNYSELEKQNILMNYRLAYEGESEVNWCQKLGTVLANDEIVDGPDGHPVSERGNYPVEKIRIKQWFLRITAYADRLLEGLEELKWSPHLKEIQKNWIGQSEGSEIDFNIKDSDEKIKIFTTRADTLFGCTYMVISPEHDLVKKLKIENIKEIEEYINKAKHKTAEERTNAEKEKTGVELKGVRAINPVNGEEVPVWISDYVLADYGTGAVMAVPAHDERDFEFAKKYGLSIKQVVAISIKDNPNIDKKTEERDVSVAVVKNPKDNTYLCLKWHTTPWQSFPTGGIDGDDPIIAAQRETLEETGYKNLKFIKQFACSIFSEFYRPHKDSNVKAHFKFFLFELINEELDEISKKEKDQHTAVWIPEKDVENFINVENQKIAWRQLFNQESFTGPGIIINSGKFEGLTSEEANKKITEFVGGKIVTKYKMRDAIFARQRYWGEPIPLWRNEKGIIHEVKKIPLKLPNVKSYEPTGRAEGPLAGVKSWAAKGFETNTMPGWAGSSWYFLRYMDPKNKKELVSQKELEYWNAVDTYVGGVEHATGHLLYARFWHKFLKEIAVVNTEEPFKELHNQGMIIASDGRRMSKRWGNVVNPDDIVKTYGADTLRVYEMFMGPFTDSIAWSTESIIGSRRFLEKVWRLASNIGQGLSSLENKKIIHKTIKKVTE